jgi:hypothetical protein
MALETSFMALSICSTRHRFGLDELFQIRLAAASEHRLPHLVAQQNDGLKVGACGQDRIADLNTNRAVPRKPLVTAQCRSRALDDAWHERDQIAAV